METGIYLITAAVCIGWSTVLYKGWAEKAKYDEEASIRILFLFLPASFFLLIAFLTWSNAEIIRIDLIALIAYDCGILCALIVSAVCIRITHGRRCFLAALVLYLIVTFIIIAAAVIVRRYPIILMKVTFYLQTITRTDLFSLSWLIVEPASDEELISQFVGKVTIALFSYIPVTLMRFLYLRRIRRHMQREIEELRSRINYLEGRIDSEK